MADKITSGHKTGILIFLFSLGLISLFLVIGNRVDFDFTKKPAVAAGTAAPDFSFPDLSGNTVRLSDYRGQMLLVNIWATWCKPCVEEMPAIEKLYQEFKDDEFNVLAVSIDRQGKKVVNPFMKIHNLSFKVLLDRDGTIQNTYGTLGIPESFIIDKNGIILQKVIGGFDWASPKVFDYFRTRLHTAP